MYFNPRSLSRMRFYSGMKQTNKHTHIDDEIWLGAQLGLFTNIDLPLPPSPENATHLPWLKKSPKDASHLKFFKKKKKKIWGKEIEKKKIAY